MTCDFCERRPCRCDNTISKAKVMKAIDEEEEFEGEMPQSLFERVKDDKEAITKMLRVAVRKTKQRIKDRIDLI